MSDRLWCVHIEGLNDYIATESRESARHEASAINAYIDSAEKGPRAAILRAVVIEWPYSADAHRRALHENRNDAQRQQPHRQPSAASPGGALIDLARRLKEFLSAGRNK